MTKLWIGLGLLIVIGALFAALSALRAKLLPEEKPLEEIPLPEKPELLRAVVHCTGGGAGFSKYNYQGVRDCLAVSQLPGAALSAAIMVAWVWEPAGMYVLPTPSGSRTEWPWWMGSGVRPAVNVWKPVPGTSSLWSRSSLRSTSLSRALPVRRRRR